MKFNKIAKFFFFISLMIISSACDLEEELFEKQTPETFLDSEEAFISITGKAYTSLYGYMDAYQVYGIQEVSSDEMVVPTRGSDWYEGGMWMRMHKHEYLPTDRIIENTWNFCYRGIATCNEVIAIFEGNPNDLSTQYIAEVKVLRALYYLWLIDLFGNVPILESNDITRPTNNSRQEVFTFIETEIIDTQDFLTNEVGGKSYSRVTYYVAQSILSSLYLNAEIYTGTPQWDKAIAACDEMIESGKFELADDYFENFITRNEGSPETIFAIPYEEFVAEGFNIHMMTLHYNSFATFGLRLQPRNGFASLQAFYESFSGDDLRKKSFIVGPQFARDGTRLNDFGAEEEDPDGPPITFTPEINSLGPNALRQAGARIGKYEFAEGSWYSLNNDFPMFRYGEILLNKAEALWRKDPTNPEALALINLFRNRANVPAFTELNEENLLAERGRELAFEGKRRTDLIRFGKYGEDWQFKPVSDPCKTLFPIPQAQLDSGGNLNQNPCY